VSVIDQYLVVATDVHVLQQVIDSVKDPQQSLAANERLKRLDSNFQSPSNAFVYFDISKMTGTIIKAMEWNFNWQFKKFKQRQAYLLGMKQRLADFRINIEQMTKDLKSSKEEVSALRIERKKKEVYEEDVSVVAERIANVETFIQTLESDLTATVEKEAEQTMRVAELTEEADSHDPYMFEFYMNSLYKPMLNALNAIDIIDSRIEFRDNNVQTEVFIQF